MFQIDPYGMIYGVLLISFLIIIPITCIISIAIAVWVYKDAQKRDMDETMWLLIVLVSGCIGCIIYLIVREPKQANKIK